MPRVARSRSKRGRKSKAKISVTADGQPDEDLTCNICMKTYTTKQGHRTHMNGHTREVTYPCLVCGRTFLRKVYVTAHMKVHKREQAIHVLPFPCTGIECKQSFVSQELLDKHLAKHTHVCPFCPKAAATRRELNYHIMKHTGAFPEMCKVCKKWYTSPKILLSHKCRNTLEAKSQE